MIARIILDPYMKYEALLATALSKNEMLFSADNALESKSIGLGGFNVAVLLGYTGLISEADLRFTILASLGICFLVFSVVKLFPILFPKSYATSSVSLRKHPEYNEKSEDDLYKQIISNVENAFKVNNLLLREKSRRFKEALLATSIADAFILISFIFN